MKIIAINGSPRKTWNTATMLQHALDGAASRGFETEMVHLYDHDYTGCTSCFACKLREGKSYGKCAVRDGLTPLLNQISDADAIILGSPIYFGIVSGMMRCFMERLLFPSLVYSNPPLSLYHKKIATAFIYSMNVAEEHAQAMGYTVHFASNEAVMTRMFGHCESLYAYETRQFEDYAKVVFSYIDPVQRVEKADRQFPIDCRRAFELGARLAEQTL